MKWWCFEFEILDISEVLLKYPLKFRTESEIWAIFNGLQRYLFNGAMDDKDKDMIKLYKEA